MAKGNRKKKKWGRPLYNPNQPLAGAPFGRTARALTRIETQPAINAQKNLIQSINRGNRRDLAALGAMGARLDQQSAGMNQRLGGYMQEAGNRAVENRDSLNARLAQSASSAQDSINQLQGSVLGGQISMLASQNAGPSASQGRLAQMAQMQQAANAANSRAFQDLGQVMGTATVNNVNSQGLAAMNTAENQRMAIARNIASRKADSRAAAAEARREARGELATMRGLRGATNLKNLLDLRREQQQFQLGRAELAQAGRQARQELGIKNRELDIEQQKVNQDGRDSGGSGGSGGEGKLTGGEYKQYSAAAKELIGGGKIRSYTDFLDRLEKREGVNWSPVERRKFRKRFKKKNPGLFG
jgi:hypothetical protein